jgi:Tol biopolymer transport system component
MDKKLTRAVTIIFLLLSTSCVSGQVVGTNTPVALIAPTEGAEETHNGYPTMTIDYSTQIPSPSASFPSGDLFFIADGNIIRVYLQNSEVETYTTQGAHYFNLITAIDGSLYFLSDLNSTQGMVEVYQMGIDNRNLRRLTDNGFYEYPLAVSSDGTHIAYVSDQHELIDEGYFLSYIDTSGNSNVQEIYRTSQWIRNLAWSPDGKKLIFFTQTDLVLRKIKQ